MKLTVTVELRHLGNDEFKTDIDVSVHDGATTKQEAAAMIADALKGLWDFAKVERIQDDVRYYAATGQRIATRTVPNPCADRGGSAAQS